MCLLKNETGKWFKMVGGFGFGFGFLIQYCRPVVGTLLPAKTWATCHSTLCFHRDSKVSIDSNDSLRNNTIINKLGNKHKNLPSYATPSSSKYRSSDIAGIGVVPGHWHC
jgi:hypothetical protein